MKLISYDKMAYSSYIKLSFELNRYMLNFEKIAISTLWEGFSHLGKSKNGVQLSKWLYI
jgi:hypothetical protein